VSFVELGPPKSSTGQMRGERAEAREADCNEDGKKRGSLVLTRLR